MLSFVSLAQAVLAFPLQALLPVFSLGEGGGKGHKGLRRSATLAAFTLAAFAAANVYRAMFYSYSWQP